jgi:predicted solute-binding protein
MVYADDINISSVKKNMPERIKISIRLYVPVWSKYKLMESMVKICTIQYCILIRSGIADG